MLDTRAGTLAAAALVAAAILFAAPDDGQAQTLQTQGDIAYVTGGVGFDEREALDAMADQERMNLKLVFAEPTGPFVSGVQVTIRNQAGEVVLQTQTTGPWMIARLPGGTYRVEAQLRGQTREFTVEVPATGRVQQVVAFQATASL